MWRIGHELGPANVRAVLAANFTARGFIVARVGAFFGPWNIPQVPPNYKYERIPFIINRWWGLFRGHVGVFSEKTTASFQVLQRSGLTSADLAQIWSLSDVAGR